jgi:hypothetical protein
MLLWLIAFAEVEYFLSLTTPSFAGLVGSTEVYSGCMGRGTIIYLVLIVGAFHKANH